MKNRNITNVIVLIMILLVLIVIGCTKQKRMTCDSVLVPEVAGNFWRSEDGLIETPEGQLITWINQTAWVFGEPGVKYRVFYGFKNGSYFSSGDVYSGNCTVIDHYSDYAEVFPTINGEICKNKGSRTEEDKFTWVTELGPCSVNEPIEQPNQPIENKSQEPDEQVVIQAQQNPSCSDSDGGLDYYTKGSVTGTWEDGSPNNTIYEDRCALGQSGNPDADKDPNALLEAYCFKGTFGYEYDYYSCPNGCNDGACIN